MINKILLILKIWDAKPFANFLQALEAKQKRIKQIGFECFSF